MRKTSGEGGQVENRSFRVRARRVLGAGFGVIALSFLLLFVPVIAYAFVLAFRARGAPDQTAINHFAATLSPALMPWLERGLALALGFWVVRRTETALAVDGLLVGVLAGLLGVSVTLAFGGSLSVRSMVSFLIVAALGWLGGFLGQKMSPSA
jgi:hypothetical protein